MKLIKTILAALSAAALFAAPAVAAEGAAPAEGAPRPEGRSDAGEAIKRRIPERREMFRKRAPRREPVTCPHCGKELPRGYIKLNRRMRDGAPGAEGAPRANGDKPRAVHAEEGGRDGHAEFVERRARNARRMEQRRKKAADDARGEEISGGEPPTPPNGRPPPDSDS